MYQDNTILERGRDHAALFTPQAYQQRNTAKKQLSEPLPGAVIRKVLTNLNNAYELYAWEVMPVGHHEDLPACRAAMELPGRFFARITKGMQEIAFIPLHESLLEGGGIVLTDEEVMEIQNALGEDKLFAIDDYNYEMPPRYCLLATENFDELLRVLAMAKPQDEDAFFDAVLVLADAVVVVEDYAMMEIVAHNPDALTIALEGVESRVQTITDSETDGPEA